MATKFYSPPSPHPKSQFELCALINFCLDMFIKLMKESDRWVYMLRVQLCKSHGCISDGCTFSAPVTL